MNYRISQTSCTVPLSEPSPHPFTARAELFRRALAMGGHPQGQALNPTPAEKIPASLIMPQTGLDRILPSNSFPMVAPATPAIPTEFVSGFPAQQNGRVPPNVINGIGTITGVMDPFLTQPGVNTIGFFNNGPGALGLGTRTANGEIKAFINPIEIAKFADALGVDRKGSIDAIAAQEVGAKIVFADSRLSDGLTQSQLELTTEAMSFATNADAYAPSNLLIASQDVPQYADIRELTSSVIDEVNQSFGSGLSGENFLDAYRSVASTLLAQGNPTGENAIDITAQAVFEMSPEEARVYTQTLTDALAEAYISTGQTLVADARMTPAPIAAGGNAPMLTSLTIDV